MAVTVFHGFAVQAEFHLSTCMFSLGPAGVLELLHFRIEREETHFDRAFTGVHRSSGAQIPAEIDPAKRMIDAGPVRLLVRRNAIESVSRQEFVAIGERFCPAQRMAFVTAATAEVQQQDAISRRCW
jgi:hypothetical protein